MIIKRMPNATGLMPLIRELIGNKNQAFNGNMVNCDFGEGSLLIKNIFSAK